MEGRPTVKKQVPERSPERSMLWNQRSPKLLGPPRRLPPAAMSSPHKAEVVYYISRNRQLEHPHFIEVPMSYSGNLFLRDVIERLDNLRGKGMASMYSWSSKRSYKNGYVWHDLSEDDVIQPSHGNEYVLKGSELFSDSDSDRTISNGNMKLGSLKSPEPQASSGSHDDSSSSSSINGKETKSSHEGDISPHRRLPQASSISPELRMINPKVSLQNLPATTAEFKISGVDSLANAATQTDEMAAKPKFKEIRARRVSADGVDDEKFGASTKECSDEIENTVSRPTSSSSASSSSEKCDTLESLIRSNLNKINSFRIFEEEEVRMPTKARMKATNLIMQLISCGSISVKDHNSFGITPTYRPRFSHSKFPSPLSSTLTTLGEFDCSSENRSFSSLRSLQNDCFGSTLSNEVVKHSFCNPERGCKQMEVSEEEERSSSSHTKCIPLTIRHAGNQSFRSPHSDKPRNSTCRLESSRISSVPPDSGSRRISDSHPVKLQSKKADSFREETVIKIEERLASGARVIIESKPPIEVESCSP